MGALHKYDLTSDVTHLIVGDHNTAKYKFVVKSRPDVKVVLSSWIEAVRASWLEGGSTDVEAEENKHKLPTYHNLRICITGFYEPKYRKQLEDEIQNAGGQYSGNLSKDVTHLIAKKPGSDKYEFARTNNIKTVSIEWHQQSLERGMILEEELFHPTLPVQDRGQSAWQRKAVSTTSLGKRPHENDGNSQNARKLRRTASAKYETQNDSLWTDINSVEVKTEPLGVDVWDEPPKAVEQNIETGALATNGSAEETNPALESIGEERQALKRTQSLGNLESSLWKPPQREALFQNKVFLLRDFDDKKASILIRHLLSHGARVIATPSEIVPNTSYLLVPHNIRKTQTESVLFTDRRPIVVTDLWIERCLHQKKLVPPHEHITSTPFEDFPIIGFEKLKVSSTGFQGIDLLHASKVVNLMGGTYEEYFTEKSTVLVCNAVMPGHEKLRHAQLWSVPAVKPDWLWDCIGQGKVLPFSDYLVQPTVSDVITISSESDKAVAPHNSGSKQMQRAKSMSNPSRSLSFTTEESKQPARRSRDSRPIEGLGKSRLRNSFPDDTGPPLTTTKPKPPQTHPSEKANKPSAPPQSPDQRRPPLQELSPNSSPTKPHAPNHTIPKHPSPPSTTTAQPPPETTKDSNDTNNDDTTLGPTISSLLSHHVAARSSTTAPNPLPSSTTHPHSPLRRRRRTLLGRAPSTHSLPHSPSRASSVDTMNTDGLGTPLEPPPPTTKSSNAKTESFKTALYDNHDLDPDRPSDEHLQMTQLGYEDEDVAAWRERVALKMAGGTVAAAAVGVGGKGGGDVGRGAGAGASAGGIVEKGKGKAEVRNLRTGTAGGRTLRQR